MDCVYRFVVCKPVEHQRDATWAFGLGNIWGVSDDYGWYHWNDELTYLSYAWYRLGSASGCVGYVGYW